MASKDSSENSLEVIQDTDMFFPDEDDNHLLFPNERSANPPLTHEAQMKKQSLSAVLFQKPTNVEDLGNGTSTSSSNDSANIPNGISSFDESSKYQNNLKLSETLQVLDALKTEAVLDASKDLLEDNVESAPVSSTVSKESSDMAVQLAVDTARAEKPFADSKQSAKMRTVLSQLHPGAESRFNRVVRRFKVKLMVTGEDVLAKDQILYELPEAVANIDSEKKSISFGPPASTHSVSKNESTSTASTDTLRRKYNVNTIFMPNLIDQECLSIDFDGNGDRCCPVATWDREEPYGKHSLLLEDKVGINKSLPLVVPLSELANYVRRTRKLKYYETVHFRRADHIHQKLDHSTTIEFAPIIGNSGSTLVLRQTDSLLCVIANVDYTKMTLREGLVKHACPNNISQGHFMEDYVPENAAVDVLNIFFDETEGQYKKHPEFTGDWDAVKAIEEEERRKNGERKEYQFRGDIDGLMYYFDICNEDHAPKIKNPLVGCAAHLLRNPPLAYAIGMAAPTAFLEPTKKPLRRLIAQLYARIYGRNDPRLKEADLAGVKNLEDLRLYWYGLYKAHGGLQPLLVLIAEELVVSDDKEDVKLAETIVLSFPKLAESVVSRERCVYHFCPNLPGATRDGDIADRFALTLLSLITVVIVPN